MDIQQAVGQRLLLAFQGKDRISPEIERAIREYKPSGITLFRTLNIDNPAQLRELNDSLQRLAREIGLPPLLIAADQEGGQLMAVGAGTPLSGNMALGATASTELARQAGEVLGRELAAMGVNIDYAPCVDVNLNPINPVVGVRSFGEDPALVARLGAELVEGIQSQGVAATAKHFPGHGDVASDSHHGMASAPHSLERLREAEFPPFSASIQAGVRLIMSAHLGLPAVDGPGAPPATLSRRVLTGLLRGELGYQGLIVTDALDMRAIQQGEALGGEAVRALQAGADLLLVTSDPQDQRRVHEGVIRAAQNGTLHESEMRESGQRIQELKDWLSAAPPRPDLSVIRSAAHMQVADEIALKSMTLVRDEAGLLPLRLQPDQRIAVILPRPIDLTPADTSSHESPRLAEAIREYHPGVDEFIIPFAPGEAEIGSISRAIERYDLIIMGTLNAFAQGGQAALAREALKRGKPVMLIALRLPYDLMAYPDAPTYLCTYSLMEPSLKAAAKCLFGHAPMTGRLPVSIPGLYRAGFQFQR